MSDTKAGHNNIVLYTQLILCSMLSEQDGMVKTESEL